MEGRWSEGRIGQDRQGLRSMVRRVRDLTTFRMEDIEGAAIKATIIGACIFICTLMVIARFPEWWKGSTPLWVPLAWGAPIVILLALARERRILAAAVAGLFFFYGAKGLLLTGSPIGWWTMGISAVLIAILMLTVPRHPRGRRRP